MVENVKSTITETERAEKAYFITTKELAEAGRDNIPDELISSKHLIYSSPATLAYNSPGAQGFGVKSCLLYTSPSPRDGLLSRMPSSA